MTAFQYDPYKMPMITKVLKVIIYIVFYVLLLLALLPLVSWWAGLIALVLAAGLYYVLFYWRRDVPILNKLDLFRVFRLSIIAVFFGVICQLGCSVYSNLRVSSLYDECQSEKASAFKTLAENGEKGKQKAN